MNKEVEKLISRMNDMEWALSDRNIRADLVLELSEKRFNHLEKIICESIKNNTKSGDSDNVLTERYCPKCNQKQKMVSLNHLETVGKRFRCMGCLTLWDEYEGKINETV